MFASSSHHFGVAEGIAMAKELNKLPEALTLYEKAVKLGKKILVYPSELDFWYFSKGYYGNSIVPELDVLE